MLGMSPISVPISHTISFKGKQAQNTDDTSTPLRGKNFPAGQYDHANVYSSQDGKSLIAQAYKDVYLTEAKSDSEKSTKTIAMSAGNSEVGKKQIQEWLEKHGVKAFDISSIEETSSIDKTPPIDETPSLKGESTIKAIIPIEQPTVAKDFPAKSKEAKVQDIYRTKGGNSIAIVSSDGSKTLIRISDGSVTVYDKEDNVLSQNVYHLLPEQVEKLVQSTAMLDKCKAQTLAMA